LYYCPIAVIINYHPLRGLKIEDVFSHISILQKSKTALQVTEAKVPPNLCLFLDVVGENPFLLSL
jgi:hypothetical protein